MSVAENGESRRLIPADVGRGIRLGANWVRRNPILAGVYFLILSIGPVYQGVDAHFFAPGRRDEAAERASAQATATAVAVDSLNRDYSETGGVDIVRQQESYLVIPRGSARLAGSEGALIDNAWARVKKDSGCQPSETVILPEVPGEHPWDRVVAPKSYLIRINC